MEPNPHQSPSDPSHVLIFPLSAQGHVNSMLKLAQLLAHAGLHVTFLNTHYIHDRLLRFTDIHTRFSQYPGFKFETISDGLPPDHPRSGLKFMETFDALQSITMPIFREMLLTRRFESGGRPPVNCIIADGIMGFAIDVGREVGVSVISFRTIGASGFWAYFCIPYIIEAGELSTAGDEDLDRVMTSVPGMENILRRRDLPSFCRSSDTNDPNLQLVMTETQKTPRADGLILNTFDDLEGPILTQIQSHCPNIYTIGPLHAHLKTRLTQSQSLNSLWEVDRSCMTWLDSQPLKSVIYVSFGSITVIEKHELMEFWYGLVKSGKKFLWVVRPESVSENESETPNELVEGTKERGFIVGWAPQEEVLAHKAVGVFLTHSGWNSTLESIVAGVPMICWPFFADQQLNSRVVSEVWRVGLDMKDVCDRGIVVKMVNDVMVERREEFLRSANEMGNLAIKSVSQGGSSFCNLDRLIQDINLGRLRINN